MDLKSLAAKPKLIPIELKDEATIAKYGESVIFYTWDRQNMDTFVKLATLDYQNLAVVASTVKELVLDSNGNSIVNDEEILPTDVMLKAINLVVEELGKSVSQNMTVATQNSK